MREPPPPPPLVVSVSSGATPALQLIAKIAGSTTASNCGALAIGGSALDARDERLLSGRAFFGTGDCRRRRSTTWRRPSRPARDEKPKKFRHGVGGL